MTIQWKVFSVQALTSQLYMLHYHEKKLPINMFSRRKAPNTQQIAITDMRKKPVDFLKGNHTGSTLSPAINLQTGVPLKKVSAPVQSTIPWLKTKNCIS